MSAAPSEPPGWPDLDFGNGKFTAVIANTGDVVHTMFDLVPIAGKCLRENS